MAKKWWILMLTVLAVGAGGALGHRLYAAASPSDYEYEYPQVNELTLPTVFGDNMVLQRDRPIHVWGLSAPGREVTAQLLFGTQNVCSASGVCGENGLFELDLPAQAASYRSYLMTVSDGVTQKKYYNVLVGEVWLSSGQSNMELQLQYIVDGQRTIDEAVALTNGLRNDMLRFYLEPTLPDGLGLTSQYAYHPQFDVKGAYWGAGNVRNDLKVMSGVSYAFAKSLFAELNLGAEVPVGILNTSLGATSIEAYMSRGAIEGNETVTSFLKGKGIYKTQSNWNAGNPSDWNYNQMTALFNHKIAPLAGYGVRGVAWYQGENNMGDAVAANYYREALPLMVEDWSKNYWGYEETLPTVYMHLAPNEYDYNSESLPLFWEGLSDAWSEHRDTLAQVPIYDVPLDWNVGSFAYRNPIHPLTKLPVGERAARAALGLVYDRYDDYLPATYQGFTREGSSLLLKFENVGTGLKAAGRALRGFAVCGEDRIFLEANAEIVGLDTVRVWNDEVAFPVAATYGFAGMNMAANLFNSIDFPTVPFRTDRVESVYYHPKDWLYADSVSLWIAENASASGERNVWLPGPVTGMSGSVTSDSNERIEGEASIRLDYSKSGGVGVNNLPGRTGGLYNPMFGQLTNFTALEFWTRAEGAQPRLTVSVKTNGGDVYRLLFLEGLADSIALDTGAGWVKQRVFLCAARDADGRVRFSTSEILADLASLEFTVEDTASGSLYLDGLRLRRTDRVEFADRIYRDSTPGEEKNWASYIDGGILSAAEFTGNAGAAGSVLLLGDTDACAEYDVADVMKFDATFYVRGGSFATLQSWGIGKGLEGNTVDLNRLIPTYCGSDGFNYIRYQGRWWKFRSGSASYQPITGDGAIFPEVTLPEELQRTVGIEYTLDGATWLDAGAEISAVVRGESDLYRETYTADIPGGAVKVRVRFSYDTMQEVNGNVGSYPERETMIALLRTDLYTSQPWNDNVAPEIVIDAPSAVGVGDEVRFICRVTDDKAAREDIRVAVKVYAPDGSEIDVSDGSFYAEQPGAYRIAVEAEDAAGNRGGREHIVSVGRESEEPESQLGLILGLTLGIGIPVLAALVLLVIKRKKTVHSVHNKEGER